MPGRNTAITSLGGDKRSNWIASGRRNEFFEWDRVFGEPDIWYARFFSYLKLDPAKRSVRAAFLAFEREHPREEDDEEADPILEERELTSNGKTFEWDERIKMTRLRTGRMSHWYEQSTKWHWTERAHAYDRHQYTQALETLSARRLQAAIEAADLGETLRKKAASAARLLSAVTQNVGTHEGKDVIIMAANLTPEQIIRMAEVGVRIEQLALGSPTENIAIATSGAQDAAAATSIKDQLRQRLMAIKARRAQVDAVAESLGDDGPVMVVPPPEDDEAAG